MVSVIIPSYNREKTIGRAIESVLNQTFRDLELIVVDDCSTDNTRQVVEEYAQRDNRVKYLLQKPNQGACCARNLGISAAKGEYIAFQDSDDEWLPEKLEKQLSAMQKKNADVCFHRLRRRSTVQGKEDSFFPKTGKSGFRSHRDMCNSTLISTQTIIAKKEVFSEHLFDAKVKKTQDYDWAIRASRNYTFYFMSEPLAIQYFQDDSISRSGSETIIKTRKYFLKKYADEFKDNPQFRIFQIETIARQKALLGQNASKEYLEIFKYDRKPKTLLKYLLSVTGLIKVCYNLLGVKKDSL